MKWKLNRVSLSLKIGLKIDSTYNFFIQSLFFALVLTQGLALTAHFFVETSSNSFSFLLLEDTEGEQETEEVDEFKLLVSRCSFFFSKKQFSNFTEISHNIPSQYSPPKVTPPPDCI